MGSDYSASVSSVPSSSRLGLTLLFPVLSFPFGSLSFPFILADFSSIHPVIGTWLAVCFFSSFLASLPQPFHKCLLPLSLPSFPLLFRFLSSASFPVPTTQPSVSSFPVLPCFALRSAFQVPVSPLGSSFSSVSTD